MEKLLAQVKKELQEELKGFTSLTSRKKLLEATLPNVFVNIKKN